jgi:hypothetical protein
MSCTLYMECIYGFGMIKVLPSIAFRKRANRVIFDMELRCVSCDVGTVFLNVKTETPWSESASELYQPSDSRLSAKLVPTFEDRRCHVVSVTDPYCRILVFSYRSRYAFFQVALQLYSGG